MSNKQQQSQSPVGEENPLVDAIVLKGKEWEGKKPGERVEVPYLTYRKERAAKEPRLIRKPAKGTVLVQLRDKAHYGRHQAGERFTVSHREVQIEKDIPKENRFDVIVAGDVDPDSQPRPAA